MSDPEIPKERAVVGALELAGGGGLLLRDAAPPRPPRSRVRPAPQLCAGLAAP